MVLLELLLCLGLLLCLLLLPRALGSSILRGLRSRGLLCSEQSLLMCLLCMLCVRLLCLASCTEACWPAESAVAARRARGKRLRHRCSSSRRDRRRGRSRWCRRRRERLACDAVALTEGHRGKVRQLAIGSGRRLHVEVLERDAEALDERRWQCAG